MKRRDATRVLVSVLSYNSAQLTIAALRCLSRQTYPEYHLQLIDNTSTDGTTELAAREFPGLDIRVLPENIGYTGGGNFALKMARDGGFDHVLICTDDVEVDERAIERMVETANACSAVGVVGGVEHNTYTGESRASGGGIYSKWFSRIAWLSTTGRDRRAVFCVHGALVFVATGALVAGVVFDENLFMYFDEADLGFQLRDKGLSALVDPRVLVRHKREPRPYSAPVGYLMQRNRLYMVRKYGRWHQRAFYQIYSTIFELPVKVLVRSLQGEVRFARACVQGHLDGLRGRMGAGRLGGNVIERGGGGT